jgi:hypothetical protein
LRENPVAIVSRDWNSGKWIHFRKHQLGEEDVTHERLQKSGRNRHSSLLRTLIDKECGTVTLIETARKFTSWNNVGWLNHSEPGLTVLEENEI